MRDYGFVHEGQVFTPNATPGITAAENLTRNQAIEAAELRAWDGKPAVVLAYYQFTPTPTPDRYLRSFRIAGTGTVTTWMGTKLGTITAARVYTHNFGGRFVSMRVRGTNGAEYYGRASWDWGSVIRLHRAKG